MARWHGRNLYIKLWHCSLATSLELEILIQFLEFGLIIEFGLGTDNFQPDIAQLTTGGSGSIGGDGDGSYNGDDNGTDNDDNYYLVQSNQI